MIMFRTEEEMLEGIEVARNFDDTKAKETAKILAESDTVVYITGMGSSLLFPAKNAKNRASALLPERRVEINFPNNLNAEYFPRKSFVFLGSNSGETIEILELVQALQERNIRFFGVTAREDSKLADICQDDKYVLQGGSKKFEKGVAATKSIIEQTLFYDALMHALAGKDFPLGKGKSLTEKVAGQMKANFEREIPEDILYHTGRAETIYWVCKDTGVGEEIALKTAEITGKRGIYQSGTQILHGIGESMKPGDMIFVLGYEAYKEKDRVGKKGFIPLADKVGAKMASIDKTSKAQNLGAETSQGYEAYSQIPAAWSLLRKVAHNTGRNIDEPGVAEKFRKE